MGRPGFQKLWPRGFPRSRAARIADTEKADARALVEAGAGCDEAGSNAERKQHRNTYSHNQHRKRDVVIIEPVFVL